MAENKIVGYKNIFGFVLPDWVDEGTIRMLITFLMSAMVILFVLIFVIWPKFNDVKKLKSTLEKGQADLTALKVSKEGFDKLNEQISEATQKIILSAIPQSYSPENAIFLLRNISNEVGGMTIVSYKIPSGVLYEAENDKSKTSAKNGDAISFMSYPIRITVAAPVDSLLTFIDKVEKSLPFGVVSDLGMQEVTKMANVTSKTVQMDLEIRYYQAALKQVDVSKIKTITPDDLALVKQLSSFSSMSSANAAENEVPAVDNLGGGSLFGY